MTTLAEFQEKLQDVFIHLRTTRHHFLRTFRAAGRDGMSRQVTLKEILKYCKVTESCYDPDPHKEAMLLGRQQVGFFILRYLNLSPGELFALASNKELEVVIEEENDE